MVPGGQLPAEQVVSISDGRAEVDHDSGNRESGPVIHLHAVALHIRILKDVPHPTGLQGVLPVGVTIGGRQNPQQLTPE